jgi:hypothetical protein
MNSALYICSSVLILFIIIESIVIIRAKNKITKLIYPFEPEGGEFLEIVIKGLKWNEISVWFEGKQAGVFSQKAMYAGQDLTISDGSILNLKLSKNNFQPERLKIFRNGQPIHRIVTEAMQQVIIDNASTAIYLIGFFNVALGFSSFFIKIEVLEPFRPSWPYVIYGSVFLILGFFTRRRSMLALMLAIIIYTLDGLIGLVIIISVLSSGYILVINPVMHIALLVGMINGIDGINAIRQKPKSKIVAFLTITLVTIMILFSCAIEIKIISLMKDLVSLVIPNQGPQIAPLVVEPTGSCTLTIKDTAGSVYMRDKADATNGKIIDYMDMNDTALVLGGDGGNPGDAWWYITTTHRGKTSKGWVFGNLVEIENSESCAKIKQIATPFP